MIWTFTKNSHNASTLRVVRWWLRMNTFEKFLISLGIAILSILLSLLVLFSQPARWLSEFLSKFAIVFFGFFVVDLIWDSIESSIELSDMYERRDIVLSTRCEYIGGHPELAESRFVYLVLGGTRENPVLSIILNKIDGPKFFINLIDITDTKSGVDDKFGRPLNFNIFMTSTTPSIWKGSRSVLNVEYTSAGRKYRVEFSSFLRGNDEVQLWKNYITCMMAEADTGKAPYGDWKSLPKAKKKAVAKSKPEVLTDEKEPENGKIES